MDTKRRTRPNQRPTVIRIAPQLAQRRARFGQRACRGVYLGEHRRERVARREEVVRRDELGGDCDAHVACAK